MARALATLLGLAALASGVAPFAAQARAASQAAAVSPLVYTATAGRVTVGFGADRADAGGYGVVTAADQLGALSGGILLLGDNYRLDHDELDLVALGPDGSLDRAFGAGGLVQVPGLGLYAVVKIAAEADGSALVLAVNQNNINGPDPLALLRLTAAGALDSAFAGGGIDRLPGLSGPADMALEPNGTIALATTAEANTTHPRVVVTRLAAQGAPIPAFGAGGAVDLPATDEQAVSIALAPDGDLLVLANPFDLGKPIMLAALTPAGTFDPAFHGGAPILAGEDSPSAAPQSADEQLLVQGDGTIEVLYSPVTLAMGEPFLSHELSIGAYTPAGAIDAAFGQAGTLGLALSVEAGLPTGEEPGTQALLLPTADEDTLVLVPTASDAPQVIRLLPDGQPDPSFGGARGRTIQLGFGGETTGEGSVSGGSDFGETAVERADGTILVAGTVELAYFNGGGTGFSNTLVTHDAVAALTPGLQRDTVFGRGGPSLALRVRVIGIRGSSLVVQVAATQAASLSAKATAGGAVIARGSEILLYDEKPSDHALALTGSAARRLRAGVQTHVALTLTARALDGQTRTVHASATIT